MQLYLDFGIHLKPIFDTQLAHTLIQKQAGFKFCIGPDLPPFFGVKLYLFVFQQYVDFLVYKIVKF